MPLFSVVIPTYNRAEMVVEAVESVLRQDCGDFEIIVVDDGSTDETKKKLFPYLDRINYVEKLNEGVSAARNDGIEESHGEFVVYLDSDDIWDPAKLSRIKQTLTRDQGIPFLFTNFRRYFAHECTYSHLTNSDIFPQVYRLAKRTRPSDIDRLYRIDGTRALDLVLGGYPFYPSTFVVNRRVHDHYRWDPKVLKSEDFNFVLRIAAHYDFYYLDEAPVVVRMHSSNKSYDSETKRNVEISTMKAFREMHIHDRSIQRMIDINLGKRLTSKAYQQVRDGECLKGMGAFSRALVYPGNAMRLINSAKRKVFERKLLTRSHPGEAF